MESPKSPIRRQRPLKGGRLRGSTGFEPRVWRVLQKESERWGVSIPFVLSVMAAECLGVELDKEDQILPHVSLPMYRERQHLQVVRRRA